MQDISSLVEENQGAAKEYMREEELDVQIKDYVREVSG